MPSCTAFARRCTIHAGRQRYTECTIHAGRERYTGRQDCVVTAET